jgi:hypothetical protein
VEGNGHGLIYVILWNLLGGSQEIDKKKKNVVRIVGVPAEIGTRYLMNTN